MNTQAELIQSLEADLKTARSWRTNRSTTSSHEVERLKKELEAKNQFIAKLEADTDDQQRKLSKLRGSESETVRLKALTEKDRSEIDALQREITQLREALARQSSAATSAASGNNAELEAKLKERENSVTRLMGTIKEHEATIKKLTEVVRLLEAQVSIPGVRPAGRLQERRREIAAASRSCRRLPARSIHWLHCTDAVSISRRSGPPIWHCSRR